MSRQNFEPRTRDLIEESAGHQCSYTACNRRTNGPGPDDQYVSRSGYAAHIYSASTGGPRGQGALRAEELRSAANGMWPCGAHAKLVDNNRGTKYPPELLYSYKAVHEARVALEHEGLYPPVGWIHELSIEQDPVFASHQKVQLAKLNMLIGENATGKTALTEWLTGFFNPTDLERWMPADSATMVAKQGDRVVSYS